VKPFLSLAPIAAGLLIVGAACTAAPSSTATPAANSGVAPSGQSSGSTTGIGAPTGSGGVSTDAARGMPAPQYASYSSSASPAYPGAMNTEGIWVTGTGKVTLAPDLAYLNLGVHTQEGTAQAARDKAAQAIDAIIAKLKSMGIAEADLHTTYFSLQPVYRYDQIFKEGSQYSQPVVIGYQVSNSLSVTVRDIAKVGQVIDASVAAGGDSTRVDGVSFTVDDQTSANSKAVELATKDALAKAQQFAALLNISLGKPVYVTQLGGYGPVYKEVVGRTAMDAAGGASVPTAIQPGQFEVTVQVQVVFAIP